MNFRKCTVALAVAAACSSAHAFLEVPPVQDPPTSLGSPVAKELSEVNEKQVGQGTAGIGLDPRARKAFVSNFNSGTLSVIDIDDPDAPAATIPVGTNPRRLVHNTALARAYIVNDTTPGTVTVVDTAASSVIATVAVGNRPRNISADFQAGLVYVSNLDSNTVSVIDTASNSVVATIAVGSSPSVQDADPLRGRVYVLSQLDRVIHVIDTATKSVVATFNTGRVPNAATVDQRTGKVYVNNVADSSVTIYDPQTATLKTLQGTGGGTTANFGSVSAIYKRYYLPNANDYTVTVIDTDTDEIVQAVPVGASPQQVAVDGSDGDVYVVNRLANSVTVFDARTNQVSGTIKVGVNPWRVAQGMDRVFTLNENGNALDSVSIATQASSLAGTTVATEWHHPAFDHYFHSTGEVENRLIGDGIFHADWTRTMDFFRVWTSAGANRVGVCRFFSDTFAPKSSHFYVPEGAECDSLKAGSTWRFEEISYFVELPDADGACRAGTSPIYRVYNNGMSGAPNHRLTGNRAARDNLVGQGWVAEGLGPEIVAACGPTLRGDEL